MKSLKYNATIVITAILAMNFARANPLHEFVRTGERLDRQAQMQGLRDLVIAVVVVIGIVMFVVFIIQRKGSTSASSKCCETDADTKEDLGHNLNGHDDLKDKERDYCGVWTHFYVKKRGSLFWRSKTYTLDSLKASVAAGDVGMDWLVSPDQISHKSTVGELLEQFAEDV